MCLFTAARTVAIVFARSAGSEAMYCAGALTFDGGFMDSPSPRTKCITERLKTSQGQRHFRRLALRYERRADVHEAFLTLGCALITSPYLNRQFSTALLKFLPSPHDCHARTFLQHVDRIDGQVIEMLHQSTRPAHLYGINSHC